MDGTLCDYDSALLRDLNLLRNPHAEPELKDIPHDGIAPWLQKRVDVICDNEHWWLNLETIGRGVQVFHFARSMGYRMMICTQAPRRNPNALSGKKRWLDKHFGVDLDFTLTRDKGLVYGRVLMDDYPKYILRWLAWRPRGLVIMPSRKWNLSFSHSQVVRLDDSDESLFAVLEALKKQFLFPEENEKD